MKPIRDIALSFEAVKVGVNQNDKGTTVRLLIHPQDVPSDLLTAPTGTRYVCALVETNDQSEPVEPERKREGSRLVASAGMLCRQPEFQEWASEHLGASEISESAAADALCEELGIESRREIADHESVQRRFKRVIGKFQEDNKSSF